MYIKILDLSVKNNNLQKLCKCDKISKKIKNVLINELNIKGEPVMNDEAKKFREKLNYTAKKIPEGFDMQYMPVIVCIDDDNSIGETIEKRLPSVSCEVLSIDELVRYIGKGYERSIRKE